MNIKYKYNGTESTVQDNGLTFTTNNQVCKSDIEVVAEPQLNDLTITTNGAYSPSGCDGYGNITVNVQPELATLTATANGTYEHTGYYGYDTVTVNVQPELTTLTATENGTYTHSGYYGYDTVTVNVAKEGAYCWEKYDSTATTFIGWVVDDDSSAYPSAGVQGNYYYKKARRVTISTSSPSGGSDGDIWVKTAT